MNTTSTLQPVFHGRARSWLGASVLLRVLLLGGLLLAVSAAAAAGDGNEEPGPEPGLYLSWHAPYGQDGASDRLVTACEDTSEIDTLYLSVVTPKTRSAIVSMTGVLYFQPQEGDTLDPFWFFKRGWPNETNLRIDFDQATGFPCEVPWRTIGNGAVSYDHRSGRGRLDLEFHVPNDQSVWLMDDRMYCFARVMIRQKRNSLSGCRQPVCVEFAQAAFANHGEHVVPLELSGGDHRFVTWNSPTGRICDVARAKSRVKAWKPSKGGTATPDREP